MKLDNLNITKFMTSVNRQKPHKKSWLELAKTVFFYLCVFLIFVTGSAAVYKYFIKSETTVNYIENQYNYYQ